MSHYDVREQFSHGDPLKTADTIAIRSINLMCALLKGVSYNQLYRLPFHDNTANSTLDKIIGNVQALPAILQRGATDNSTIVFDTLGGPTGALMEIRAVINREETHGLSLGSLFYKRAEHHTEPDRTVLMEIVRILDGVHSRVDDQMIHFCTPFISMQMKYTNYTTEGAVTDFLDVLGDRNIRDFYDDYQRIDGEREAAKLAIDFGILKDRGRPGRPVRHRSHDGNARKCQPGGGGCIDSTLEDDWCNTVIIEGSPQCAMGSDY